MTTPPPVPFAMPGDRLTHPETGETVAVVVLPLFSGKMATADAFDPPFIVGSKILDCPSFRVTDNDGLQIHLNGAWRP